VKPTLSELEPQVIAVGAAFAEAATAVIPCSPDAPGTAAIRPVAAFPASISASELPSVKVKVNPDGLPASSTPSSCTLNPVEITVPASVVSETLKLKDDFWSAP
jgi:hypothetical protein